MVAAPRLDPRALAAEAWVEMADLIDLQLSPLGLKAIDALAPQTGEVILDIGCGSGQTVLQLAERVGRSGQIIGVDIAPQLVALAKARAVGLRQVSFIEADAQHLDLPRQSADGLFSRFGVMAFTDPVAAFTRFHDILKPGGRLAFVCWRTLAENELDYIPLRAAGLENLMDATPFRFAEPDYVRDILEQAGFRDIQIDAHDQRVSSGGLDAMTRVLLKVGPLGRILRETPALRADAEPKVRAALATREAVDRVSLTAAIWIVWAGT